MPQQNIHSDKALKVFDIDGEIIKYKKMKLK